MFLSGGTLTIYQYLSCDHHPKIAFAAVRTDYILEHTLLNSLSDADERKDLARCSDSSEAAPAEVLAKIISENDPASPRYQAELRDHMRKDRLSSAVTELTPSIIAPTNRS